MPGEKILLISQVFYPDEVAVANLFTKLCSVFTADGKNMEVWCAQPSYTTLKRQPKKQIYKNIKITYLCSWNFHKDNVAGRLLNYMTFSTAAVFRLLFSGSVSLVISHTAPPFLAIIISFICRLKKQRHLYVILDVFPDGLIRIGKFSSGNILIRLWQKLHNSALRRCTKIIVIGRDMKEWLASVCPEAIWKTEYIPVWQDKELMNNVPYENNTFVAKHNLQNEFVVQYSGNMGLWNDMETFGKVVSAVPDEVKFVFIGGGMRYTELTRSFKDKDPANVLLLPFIPNSEYAISVSACHAGLVSLRREAKGMAVPSKIIGIMAAGIPVIAVAPEESEIALIVKEENCGIVVNPGDTYGLVQAINILKSDELLRQTMGRNGRYAFENKYTTEIIARKYLSLFREIL